MRKVILALAVMALVGCSGGGSEDTGAADGGGVTNPDTNQNDLDDQSGDHDEQEDQGGGNQPGTDGEDQDGGTTDPTEPTDPVDPPVAPPTACAQTGVGYAFESVSATSTDDPDLPPSNLIDGCTTRAKQWSGNNGAIVTLDAGSPHEMQGIYIWSSYARMEFLKIETAGTDQVFRTDFHAVPTKPVSGPVYYPFESPGAIRYVRITGYGSDVNGWTNLAEVRWSSTGWNVTGERVWRERDGDSAVSLARHDLAWPSAIYVDSLRGYTHAGCGTERTARFIDATGLLGDFYSASDVGGTALFRYDFDHLPRAEFTDIVSEGPDELYELAAEAHAAVGGLDCLYSGTNDAVHQVDHIVRLTEERREPVNYGGWVEMQ